MRHRDALFIVLAALYGLSLIGLTTAVRARAEARTQRAPEEALQLPSVPPSPILVSFLTQVPEAPRVSPYNLPEIPAMPAIPAIPPIPEVPAWSLDTASSWSSHGGSPASDCSDLNIRLRDDERPTIESEERSVTKAEAPVLRVRDVRNAGVQFQGW